MKSAEQYPISFPYHGTPYTIYPKHHGTDYAAPIGTPVVISGVTIGLTGNTGYSTGPHLHVDRADRYPASRLEHYSNPTTPTKWYNIQGTVVFAGNAGSAGNMVVIKTPKGNYFRFLHLSKINAKVGQKITSLKKKVDIYMGQTAKHWYTRLLQEKTKVTKANKLIEKKDKLIKSLRDELEKADKQLKSGVTPKQEKYFITQINELNRQLKECKQPPLVGPLEPVDKPPELSDTTHKSFIERIMSWLS